MFKSWFRKFGRLAARHVRPLRRRRTRSLSRCRVYPKWLLVVTAIENGGDVSAVERILEGLSMADLARQKQPRARLCLLLRAVRLNRVDIAQLLLGQSTKELPLWPLLDSTFLSAVCWGYLDIVKVFVATDAVSDGGLYAAFVRSVTDMRPHLVDLLYPYRIHREQAVSGAYGHSPLPQAARHGNLDLVKLLLEDFDPKEQDSEAFVKALKYGHIEVASFLAPLSDPDVVRKYL